MWFVLSMQRGMLMLFERLLQHACTRHCAELQWSELRTTSSSAQCCEAAGVAVYHVACNACMTACCEVLHAEGRGCFVQAQKAVRPVPGEPVPLTLTPQVYLQRLSALAALQAAWSPICSVPHPGITGILGWKSVFTCEAKQHRGICSLLFMPS